jgi:hypothetical protein
LAGSTARSLEFKTVGRIRTSLEGQYYADTRRSAELHIGMESLEATDAATGRDARLNRLAFWKCREGIFPTLEPADQLIGQAQHLLSHLRHEHTRVSWLLEFRHHVRTRGHDAEFWHAVQTRAAEQPETAIALGLSTLLATELFGRFAPPELDAWTVATLPPMVRVWADLYGRRAVLADVPGTKLHLLLEDALQGLRREKPRGNSLRQLMPLRRPGRMLPAKPPASLRERVRRETIELHFLLFRLRFHVREGFRYLVESQRWRRLSACYEELRQTASRASCQLHSE